ncbi:MAG: hypothetical protein ABI076_04545 [Acidobacteriaceae bacterium]
MTITLRSYLSLAVLFPVFLLLGTPGVQVAVAQAPPNSVTAQTEGPTVILVTWTECLSSDQANCEENFYVYRNPLNSNTIREVRL